MNVFPNPANKDITVPTCQVEFCFIFSNKYYLSAHVSGTYRCVDVNECEIENKCGSGYSCQNTIGEVIYMIFSRPKGSAL